MKPDRRQALWVAAALAVSAAAGCAGNPPEKSKEVIAYVNREPVTRDELRRDIALRVRLDPSFVVTSESAGEQLEAIIDRKIIVQSAMERGLAREDRFVSAMRKIWEQTLIRDFVDYKNREFEGLLSVSDDDVKRYYANMSSRVTFKVFKTRDRARRAEELRKRRAAGEASGWQVVGPMAYEDISSSVLLKAFEGTVGSVQEMNDGGDYYLIEVLEKTRTEAGPMESLRPEIEKRVLRMKQKRLFDEWLSGRKSASRIRIDTAKLEV